jgi:hypothetical protein
MATGRSVHAALNRGLVSRLGLAREDIERVGVSGDVWTNFVPRVLGSMQIRPGWKFVGATQFFNRAYFVPFVFSITDKAALEFTNGTMRIWIDDVPLERTAVSSQVSNGEFLLNADSWTDASDSGGVIGWQAGALGAGYLSLQGNGSAFGRARQRVTINLDDQNVEHGLRVQVQAGPIKLKLGTFAGGQNILAEQTLEAGGHSIAFTPPLDGCWIEVSNNAPRVALVDSITIEAGGPIDLPSPFLEEDLHAIRGGTDSQSGDIVFLAADGYQQWQIQRRAFNSWSLVLFQPEDGPFLGQNADESFTLTPSVLRGNGTLTASQPLFAPNHIGGLFRIQSEGQRVEVTVTTDDSWSTTILIQDSGERRKFTVSRSGTWVATVTLQRSFLGPDGPWETAATYTTNDVLNFNDTLDGEQTWYRIGVDTGDFTSGSIELSLDYQYGTATGVCRITNYTSELVCDIEILTDMGRAEPSSVWWEGAWSGIQGFPTATCFFEGRLFFAGRDRVWASATDNFYTFDELAEGDDASFSRTIGTGSVDAIHWLLPLQRLCMGGEGAEFTIRSSSLDEPLTPTNANLKRGSTQGSADVQAVAVDERGFFVQRGGTRVFDIALTEQGHFGASHVSALVPEIGQPEIVRLAVQRQPDTRVHCVRSDGTVAMLLFDSVEQVTCWIDIETDGEVEDVFVLPGDPGTEEDQVYYVVSRTINTVPQRSLERWALESETRGEQFCFLADSFIVYTGDPITGAFDDMGTLDVTNLAGKDVVLWHNGADIGHGIPFDNLLYRVEVDPLRIEPPFPEPITNFVIGLPYEALWRSTKLTRVQVQSGTTLTTIKAIRGLGLVLADVHPRALRVGPDFVRMDNLPLVVDGRVLGNDEIVTDRDETLASFAAKWGSDPRLCLRAIAPRPVTVQALVLEMDTQA